MPIYIDCEQGSPQWDSCRVGRVTGSRIADVMAKGKNGNPSVTRANYLAEIVAERFTGQSACEKFQTQAMRLGSEREPQARSLYAFMRDAEPKQVGFVVHGEIERAGASPDSLIGDKGLIEIKSPQIGTHLDTLLGANIDGRYLKQMQWQLCVTQREWVDFVSYCPLLPPEMQLHIRRIERDDAQIREMEIEVRRFLVEVDQTVAKLQSLYMAKAA